MDVNFIYEVKNWKYIIWEKKDNKIYNKRYFFWNLWDLDIKDKTEIFLDDIFFNFEIKSFIYDSYKKISIKHIENNLKDFWDFIWYTILNIVKNWQKSKFILWQSWEISYDIWTYNINKLKYNEILKYFWKNIKLNIFPNSFFLIKCIWEEIKNWSILYLLKNNTKLINIKKWFYKNIEKLDIWIYEFNKNIKNIFWKNINSIENMSTFNQKVYIKELNKFLEPIILFLKNNLLNNNIYIIWDFKNAPLLLKILWDKLDTNIIPIRIDNKTFTTTEKANIYFILKNKKLV